MGWWLAREKPVLVTAGLLKVNFVLPAMQPPAGVVLAKKQLAQRAIQPADRYQVLRNQPTQAKPVPRWPQLRVPPELVTWRSDLPEPASSSPAQRLSIASRD